MPAIMGKMAPAMSEIVWSRGKNSFLFVDVRATLGSHLSSLLKLEKISKFLDASKWVKVVKDASTLMRSTFFSRRLFRVEAQILFGKKGIRACWMEKFFFLEEKGKVWV